MVASESDALAPGTMHGRYEIRRELGRGGMGAVYEAVHRDLKKRVAVKVLSTALAANPQAVIIAVTPSHATKTAPVMCRPVTAWPHPGSRKERQNAPIGRMPTVVSLGTLRRVVSTVTVVS